MFTFDGRLISTVFRFSIALILFAAVFTAAGLADEEDEKAVARVNERDITRAEYVRTLEILYGPDAIQHLVARELLRQEARRRNLLDEEELRERIMSRVSEDVDALLVEYARMRGYRNLEEYSEAYGRATGDSITRMRERLVERRVFVQELNLLAEILLLADGEIDLSPERLRSVFELEFGPRVVIRQIVTPTQAEAEQVLNQLRAGADFRVLALEKSIDEVSAERAGLVWPPLPQSGSLGEAAFKLRAGQTSEIIRTDDGFHIIRLESRLPARNVAFDDIRDDLRWSIIRSEVEDRMPDLLYRLRNRAEVEEFDMAPVQP